MSNYTVRVELHGATSSDYETLHHLLEAEGFSREIKGIDSAGAKGAWQLPTAEYDFKFDENKSAEVRDKVKAISDGVKAHSWVLVTEVKTRSWTTKKVKAG